MQWWRVAGGRERRRMASFGFQPRRASPSSIRTSVSVDNVPPRVVIESASVEHKLQTAVNQVVLRPGQTNLEVQYTALSYSRPEQISFRYKLDGVDDDWQEVGHRRTAYYTHLPPAITSSACPQETATGSQAWQTARCW